MDMSKLTKAVTGMVEWSGVLFVHMLFAAVTDEASALFLTTWRCDTKDDVSFVTSDDGVYGILPAGEDDMNQPVFCAHSFVEIIGDKLAARRLAECIIMWTADEGCQPGYPEAFKGHAEILRAAVQVSGDNLSAVCFALDVIGICDNVQL